MTLACDAGALPATPSVHWSALVYWKCFVLELFDVLTWRRGEHVQGSDEMIKFVRALYALCGLAEDPPGEFDDSCTEGWFSILEVTVERESEESPGKPVGGSVG